MKFVWDILSHTDLVISSSITAIILFIVLFIFFVIVKRIFPIIVEVTVSLCVMASFIFYNLPCLIASSIAFTCFTILFLYGNIGDLRSFISNFRKNNINKKHKDNFNELRKILYETVAVFSKSHTGAIITLEKDIDLDSFCKNGIIVDAPVTKELLETIFYVGTRLHDGAVIIKNNKIAAASVFFVPSTKSYVCKYGSRHRAAIGISEVTDSVTIVVSEETGNISFATKGRIEKVELEEFEKMFTICMNE